MSETNNLVTQNPNERIIRPYGKYAKLIKNEKTGEVFLRHTFTANDPNSYWRTLRAVEATRVGSHHPNAAIPLLAIKHQNGDVDVDVEFADAGSIAMYIKLIREKFTELDNEIKKAIKENDSVTLNRLLYEKRDAKLHQIQMAKSVARQLLEYCFYLDSVLDRTHKNLNPQTVLLRRDGCLKTTFFNYLDKNYIKANRFHFLEFNAYVAPEVISEKISTDLMNIAKKQATKKSPMFNRDKILSHRNDNIEHELFIENMMSTFSKNTDVDITSSAIKRIQNVTIKSDIWSIGAILYSIMTCTNFMPTWEYKEPIYTPDATSHYQRLYDRKIEYHNTNDRTKLNNDISIWTEEDENALNIAYEQYLLEEERKKEHINKYKSFIEFIISSDDQQWAETFGNDPFLTHIARRCLDVNEITRSTISELNSFIYLAGGFVIADTTQSYTSPDDRSKLKPISMEKLYEKLQNDPLGRKYELKQNWNQVWDAFSTDCTILSRPVFYDENTALRALENDGSIMKKAVDNNSVTSTQSVSNGDVNDRSVIFATNREKKSFSIIDQLYMTKKDPLDEENHGESIFREIKYFDKTRFGKIYKKEYCRDTTITDEMIRDKTLFSSNDLINPDDSIIIENDNVSASYTIWVINNKNNKNISIHDISILLQLESRMFRKRRNMGSNSVLAVEKKRRQMTKSRQICAWIALGRACVFFREGYTK